MYVGQSLAFMAGAEGASQQTRDGKKHARSIVSGTQVALHMYVAVTCMRAFVHLG